MQQNIQTKLTYKRTSSIDYLTIESGQTSSSILDCGGMQPRALLFPSNWTSSTVSLFIDVLGVAYSISYIDGTAFNPATVASQCLPIIASLTDFVSYLSISSSVAQSQTVSVIVLLEPIYQGIHG